MKVEYRPQFSCRGFKCFIILKCKWDPLERKSDKLRTFQGQSRHTHFEQCQYLICTYPSNWNANVLPDRKNKKKRKKKRVFIFKCKNAKVKQKLIAPWGSEGGLPFMFPFWPAILIFIASFAGGGKQNRAGSHVRCWILRTAMYREKYRQTRKRACVLFLC